MTTTAKVRLSNTDSSTYALTPNDLNAFTAFLRAQGNTGAAQSSVGQAQLWDLFGVVNDMAYDHYRLTSNQQLKSWMDVFFKVIIETPTSYTANGKSVTATGMYILYMYYQFNNTCMWDYIAMPQPSDACSNNGFPTDCWQRGAKNLSLTTEALRGSEPWTWFVSNNNTALWKPAANIGTFYDAINTAADLLNGEVRNRQNSTSTVGLSWEYNSVSSLLQFQQSRFDPANWTDSDKFVEAINATTIRSEQLTLLKQLIKATDLDESAYLFIFCLIIALTSSDITSQQLAQKITNTVTPSMEYPNDTFINQLVYLILMQMADPLGDFVYNNAMLQKILTSLINAIVVSNDASKLILTSLQKHVKILIADASYPMQDPYNPNIGFDTRQTDTIAALDEARGTMSL